MVEVGVERAKGHPIHLLWGLIVVAELVAVITDQEFFRDRFGKGGFELPLDLKCFWANGALAIHHSTASSAMVAKICPFMYPPPFLMLTAPLFWLSPFAVFAVWTAITTVCIVLAGRAINLPWHVIGAGILSPAGLQCVTCGQTGMIISALLLLALGLADTSPFLAGFAAGSLIIKPQFALLLPFCFIASQNWRAFWSAAASTTALCLLSLLLFGPGVWVAFFHDQIGMAAKVLARPWPQPFQHIMISVFILVRSLGARLPVAYAMQSITTIIAVCAASVLWSSPRWRNDPLARLTATLCLVMLATPYAYIYDIPALALALTGYALREKPPLLSPLTVFFLITGFYIWLGVFGFPPIGAGLLVLLLLYVWSRRGSSIVPWQAAPGRVMP